MTARGLLVILVAALSCLPVRAEDVTMARLRPDRSGFTAEKVSPPLALAWKFAAAEDRHLSAQPLVYRTAEGLVRIIYCASGVVYSLDAETGEIVWQYPRVDRLEDIRVTPFIHNDRLFITTVGAQIHILSMVDGADAQRLEELLRLRDLLKRPVDVRAAPALVGETLYLQENEGLLMAIDLRDFQVKQLRDFQSSAKDYLLFDEGLLYFTGRDNIVYAYDVERERVRWAQKQGTLVTPPLRFGEDIVIGNADRVRGLRIRTGANAWDTRPSPVLNPMAMTAQRLYYFGVEKQVRWIDARDRTKTKHSPYLETTASVPLTIAHEDVYFGTTDGNLYCLNAETLAINWFYKCNPLLTVGRDSEGAKLPAPEIRTPVVVSHGYVVVADAWGTLYCFQPDAVDAGQPRVYLPQIVTNSSDPRTMVGVVLHSDKRREEELEYARATAPKPEDGGEPEFEVPEIAKVPELSGKQPVFRFECYVYDEGSGINFAGMQVEINDTVLRLVDLPEQITFRPNEQYLSINLLPRAAGAGSLRQARMSDGLHRVVLRIPDFKGNVAEQVYTFKIDNNLQAPPPPATATPAGSGDGIMDPGMAGPPPGLAP